MRKKNNTKPAEKISETRDAEWKEEKIFCENEKNGFTTAAAIGVNMSVSDALVSLDDEKYYKFLAVKAGEIEIKFSHEYVDSAHSHWAFRLYNADIEELIYRSVSGKELSVTLPKLKISSGIYYIKITHAAYGSSKWYHFIVNYKEASYWEREWKDFCETISGMNADAVSWSAGSENPAGPFHQSIFDDRVFLRVKLTKGSKVKLIWNELQDADGYEIYRTAKKTVPFKKIKKISDGNVTSYKDRRVSIGHTYYYKIRAYKKNQGQKLYLPFSFVRQAKIGPVGTSILRISSFSPKEVTLMWRRVSGADGYEIYRASGKHGRYKKIAVIKSEMILSYTDRKRKSSSVCYYKVRAYLSGKGEKVYGDFSAPEYVKVK